MARLVLVPLHESPGVITPGMVGRVVPSIDNDNGYTRWHFDHKRPDELSMQQNPSFRNTKLFVYLWDVPFDGGETCAPTLLRCFVSSRWLPGAWALTQVRKMPNIGPEIGPTSALYSRNCTGMHGPTCIFWANLTPVSLPKLRRSRDAPALRRSGKHAAAGDLPQRRVRARRRRAAAVGDAERLPWLPQGWRRAGLRLVVRSQRRSRPPKANFTGLAQNLAQLQASNRNFQPNC